MEMDTLFRVKLYGLLHAINEPIFNVNWEKSTDYITRIATYKIEITTCEEGMSENMQMETPMNEIIKNRISTYQINKLDFQVTKEKLMKELSEYLHINEEDIDLELDSLDINVDSLDKEQLGRLCGLFDDVRVVPIYGDQLKVMVDLEDVKKE